MKDKEYDSKSFRLNKITIKNLATLKLDFKSYNIMFAELIKMYSKLKTNKTGKVQWLDLKEGDTCHYCKIGTIELKQGKYGDFWGCNNFPRCGFVQNIKGS